MPRQASHWFPALAVALLLVACRTPLSEVPPELVDCSPTPSLDSAQKAELAECVNRPEVEIYLKTLKRDMYREWHVDYHGPPGVSVVMSFTLGAQGQVRGACVRKSADERLSKSAVRALFSAAPFDTMTERVSCLAERRLIGTFTLPPDS